MGAASGRPRASPRSRSSPPLLGGVVGCSRAVTNNGWRNHTDQVGQTGTRIAPDLYFACGISGAIQHWVGAMAAKHIIAVNTDPGANMVTKADYAVIGDLHEVVPAITAEIRRRRSRLASLGVGRERLGDELVEGGLVRELRQRARGVDHQRVRFGYGEHEADAGADRGAQFRVLADRRVG